MGCSDYPCSAAQVASSSEASAGRRYHYQVASHGPGEAAAAGPGPRASLPAYLVRCQRRSGVRRTVALWHRQARVPPSLPRVGLPASRRPGLPGASGRGACPRAPATADSSLGDSDLRVEVEEAAWAFAGTFKITVTPSHRPPGPPGPRVGKCPVSTGM